MFDKNKVKNQQRNWQRIVKIMAEMLDTTAAIITKVDRPYIKIIKTNKSHSNPLKEGDMFELAGHYCERVIKTEEKLEIANSIKNDNWEDNPELEYGLISYLGFPILTPDNDIFGTICVLDREERHYKESQKDLMLEFKKVIENQLENIRLNEELSNRLDQIKILKEKYELLFNNINDALFLHKYNMQETNDKIGKFIEVNEEAWQRLGYTKEELLQMSPDDIDSSRFDSSKEKTKILKKLEEEKEVTFEAEHETRTGKKIPVEINSKIINYNDQKTVLSIARDITRRKKAENKLKRQKNFIHSSLDSLSANIAVLNENGVIEYINQAWSDFAKNNGLSPENWGKGINYLEVCENAEGEWAEEAPAAAQGIREVIKGRKEFFTLEYPCHSAEEKRWFQMRVTPFRGEGDYAAVVSHVNVTERKFKEQEIKSQKQRFEKILETTMDGFFILDSEGRFMKVNQSYLDMVGYTEDKLLNMNIYEIESKESVSKVKEHLKLIKEGGSDCFESLHETKNGKIIDVEISTTYVDEDNGSYYFAFVRDITERKESTRKMKEIKKRLELAVEGAGLGIWDWNVEKGSVEFNENWANMLGYKLEKIEYSIETWKELIHQKDKEKVMQKLEKHLQGKTDYYESEHRLKTKNGKYKWVKDIGRVLDRDKSGEPLRAVGIHLDIDERKRAEERIQYLSFHDEMTGLFNRRFFENEIEILNESRKLPITIIVGDMDGLKYINDNYGHKMGDKYIKKCADIFNLSTRSEDIVARIGGDEFAVILPETDTKTAQKLCERIKNESQKCCNNQTDIPESLSISLGYATKEKKIEDLHDIFNKADQEMYKNKFRYVNR